MAGRNATDATEGDSAQVGELFSVDQIRNASESTSGRRLGWNIEVLSIDSRGRQMAKIPLPSARSRLSFHSALGRREPDDPARPRESPIQAQACAQSRHEDNRTKSLDKPRWCMPACWGMTVLLKSRLHRIPSPGRPPALPLRTSRNTVWRLLGNKIIGDEEGARKSAEPPR